MPYRVFEEEGKLVCELNGERVSRKKLLERYPRAFEDIHPALLGNRPWTKPVHSDALAVHPKQIGEAVEDARRKGVPTDFDRSGRPIFGDRDHKKRYCQAYGFYDRSGGYGDAQTGKAGLGKRPIPTDYVDL